MAEPALSKGFVPQGQAEFGDIQGLLRFGHGHLTDACFFLLELVDRGAARSWLQAAPVTTALATDPRLDNALQVAFTREGLQALGVPAATIEGFSDEFISGMAGEESRSRRLGDIGANAPGHWAWGAGAKVPHLLVLLYALPGRLKAFEEALAGETWNSAFRVQAHLPTSGLADVEPFGFVDNVSQPAPDWTREQETSGGDRRGYGNILALGEFLLGYPNEYGEYTDRPLVDPGHDPHAETLPPAEDAPGRRDLGRNGTYLVFRQLHQDVRSFWQFLDRQTASKPAERWRLAETMVGRTRSGQPLVSLSRDPIPGVGPGPDDIAYNQFTYDDDPAGTRCPLGAHVRRANPRSGDLPEGANGLASRLIRILGFRRRTIRDDLVASSRFHRILRRGRTYGAHLSPEEALQPGPPNEEQGLHFICLGASISRQFEFVQNAWLMSTKFNSLTGESDPLLGTRQPLTSGRPTDTFSIPEAGGLAHRVSDLPQFVTVRGGAYFFLPGIRALKYIASLTS